MFSLGLCVSCELRPTWYLKKGGDTLLATHAGSRGAEEDTDEDMEVDNEEEDEGRDAEEGEEDDGYEYDDEEDGAMSAEEEGERLSFPGGVYLTAKCVRDAKPSRIQKSVVDAMMDMLDRIKKCVLNSCFSW